MSDYAKNKINPLLVVAVIALIIFIVAGGNDSLPSYEAKTAVSTDDISTTDSKTNINQNDNSAEARGFKKTNLATDGKVYGMTTGALVMPILDSRILSVDFYKAKDSQIIRGIISVDLERRVYVIGMFPGSEFQEEHMGEIFANSIGDSSIVLNTPHINLILRDNPGIKTGLYLLV